MSAFSIWIQSLVGKSLRSGKIMYRAEQTYLSLWNMPVTEVEIIKLYKEIFSDIHQIAKAIVSFFMSICLCLCMEQLCSHWMDFMKFDI